MSEPSEHRQTGIVNSSRLRQMLMELPFQEIFPYWSNLFWKESIRPLLQQMVQYELTMSENQVLRHLQGRSLSIAGVAEYLSISPSAASRAVDRLVRDGFVSRMENPEDRRQKHLMLTPRGTALVEQFNHIFTTGMERLVSSLPLAEQEQFRLLLVQMILASPDEAGAARALDPAE